MVIIEALTNYDSILDLLPSAYKKECLVDEGDSVIQMIPPKFTVSLDYFKELSRQLVNLETYSTIRTNLEPRTYVDYYIALSIELFGSTVLKETKLETYCSLLLKEGVSVGCILYSLLKIKLDSYLDPIGKHGYYIEDIFAMMKNNKKFNDYYVNHYSYVALYGDIVDLFDNVVAVQE